MEAWNELCDLYLREFDFAKAAFCMEELIVLNPNNHLYHLKYADVSVSKVHAEFIVKYFSW